MEFFKKILRAASPEKPATFVWLDKLKEMDDVSAIEYSAQQLNIDFKNNLFQNKSSVDALLSVDEKIHPIVERVSTHYVHVSHIGAELEERMANTVFLYHRQMFLIYQTLIANLAEDNHASLVIMLARAMNSATEMIKWRFYNYSSAPANVWLQISSLFQLAERKALLNTPVQLYQNLEAHTLTTAYLKACMLGNLESLSFKRQQVELVCATLDAWSSKITIDQIYDEGKHLFYVDTALNMPAKRIRGLSHTDTCRYWCIDGFNTNVELCISLIEFKILPTQHAMKDIIHHKFALTTLQTLHAEWSRVSYKRQRRAEVRVKTSKSAIAAYGFEDTCYQLKQFESLQATHKAEYYASNASFEERLASHNIPKGYSAPPMITYMDLGADHTTIMDEGNKGLGLITSKKINSISLGLVVGVSLREGNLGTSVGVIRSIRPAAGNDLFLGVKILSKSALCIEANNISQHALTNSQNVSAEFNRNSTSNFTCIYIPPEEHRHEDQASLILPILQYNKNDTYKVRILGEEMEIKFTDTLDQFEDLIRVAYSRELTTH